jgi:hypothetical protein
VLCTAAEVVDGVLNKTIRIAPGSWHIHVYTFRNYSISPGGVQPAGLEDVGNHEALTGHGGTDLSVEAWRQYDAGITVTPLIDSASDWTIAPEMFAVKFPPGVDAADLSIAATSAKTWNLSVMHTDHYSPSSWASVSDASLDGGPGNVGPFTVSIDRGQLGQGLNVAVLDIVVTDPGDKKQLGIIVEGPAPNSYQQAGSWGTQGRGDSQFNGPAGVDLKGNDQVYVVDSGNSRVQIFSPDGAYTGQFGTPGTGDGQLGAPWGVVIGPSGNCYIGDSGNNRIQKFSPANVALGWWGMDTGGGTGWHAVGSGETSYWGTADGEFNFPSGVAAGKSGHVYVCDTWNHRVQQFDDTGTHIRSWGSAGTGVADFAAPLGITVGPRGDVYVADTGNCRIKKYTDDGQLLTMWGGSGTGPGQFLGNGETTGAMDVTCDSSGYVYATDAQNGRVQKFNADANFVTAFGSYGNGPQQFVDPSGIAVDRYGKVYIADTGNNRVQVWMPIIAAN